MNSALDANSTIVFGTELRILLNSEHISYGEVHATLKEKGIFVGSTEKSTTVPLLSATLLTPSNFSRLIDSCVTRDSQPKMKVSTLPLVSTSANWIEPLKEHLFSNNLENILGENGEFSSSPEVVVTGSNTVSIPYTIRRQDFSKDWIQRELYFNGEILVERRGKSMSLDFVSTHSSKETEAINRRITSRISQVLHQAKLVAESEPIRITFGSFNNEERVRFFKRLTAGWNKILSTGNVLDIEVSLDTNGPPLPVDPEIAWMKQSVRRLTIDGDRLNDIFLMANENYYKHYHIQRMDVTFTFKDGPNTGESRVSFSFSSAGRIGVEAELTFECARLGFENAANADAKKAATSAVQHAIRSLIDAKYTEMLDERTASKPHTTTP